MSQPEPKKSSDDSAPHSRPEDRLTIRILHLIDVMFCRVYHHVNLRTPCQLPKSGPAMLVSNHIGTIDPGMLQACCSYRLITWMMAAEYMDIPFMKPFFRAVEVIPVERTGKDSTSLRTALRALDQGRVLGIFPEGSFSKTRELKEFRTGVAMIAMKTGVPVYPAFIDGTHRNQTMIGGCLKPSDASVTFGPRIEMPTGRATKEITDAATDKIRSTIISMRDREFARRAANGGHWD